MAGDPYPEAIPISISTATDYGKDAGWDAF